MNQPRQQSLKIVNQLINALIESISPTSKLLTHQFQLRQTIPHFYHEEYHINQGKCYQQYSSNLCGYHAVFNSFCFLKMLSSPLYEYDIEKGADFWRFKLLVQRFLLTHKENNKIENVWPWRQQDIKFGDFQRVYNQICHKHMKQFAIFHNNQNFLYLSHTWSFQYSNLLLDDDSKESLHNKIKAYRAYNENKPMVLHLMLGITTHWLAFFAVKTNNISQYWFFDSQNDKYLHLCGQQIKEYIQQQSVQAKKTGKKQYTNFEKQTYCVGIKDIQQSLRLIIDCLQGKQDIHSYCYNQKFIIFAKHLQKCIKQDYDNFSQTIREYQFNIASFFIEPIQWNLLNKQNSLLLQQIIKFCQQNRNCSQQIMYLYELCQMHL